MTSWTEIQKEAIEKWVESVMEKRVLLNEVNGIIIIQFLEKLSSVKYKTTRNKVVKTPFDQMEIAEKALEFGKSLGLKYHSVEAIHIVSHNEKMLLSLFISVATKFVPLGILHMRSVNDWVKEMTQLPIQNFKSDWEDGYAIKFIFADDHPFELFSQFGITQVIQEKNLGKDEITMKLQIALIYYKKEEIEKYRFNKLDINKVMTEKFEERKTKLRSEGIFDDSHWVPIKVNTEIKTSATTPILPNDEKNNNILEVKEIESKTSVDESFSDESIENSVELEKRQTEELQVVEEQKDIKELYKINKEEENNQIEGVIEKDYKTEEDKTKEEKENQKGNVDIVNEEKIQLKEEEDSINSISEEELEKTQPISSFVNTSPNESQSEKEGSPIKTQISTNDNNSQEEIINKSGEEELLDNNSLTKSESENKERKDNEIEDQENELEIIQKGPIENLKEAIERKELINNNTIPKVQEDNKQEDVQNEVIVEKVQKETIKSNEDVKSETLNSNFSELLVERKEESNTETPTSKKVIIDGRLRDSTKKPVCCEEEKPSINNKKEEESLGEELPNDPIETEKPFNKSETDYQTRTFEEQSEEEISNENKVIEEYKDTFKNWTGMTHHSILYDSSKDELTAMSFNNKVEEKSNVMILVITKEGYSFGCFNKKQIPKAPKKGYKYIKNDKDFFVFSLRSKELTQPVMIQRKKKGKSLCIWNSSCRVYTFTVKRFMRITKKTEKSHFISNLFTKEYKDTTKKGTKLFTGENEFSVDKVLAIQWSLNN
ncbi:E3 ubiquitin protein ligase BRE1, putative [Entamoeba dispar SAW760]|uniref:E3 ubiquitin protein ligase BRE1, putative n=1 Tax=Entamoeba dispar (strain ATCC PRA-260 / SAW760) TaxID=370354 RepID=B0ELW4_ENTDS|nr:E3 ubiquitin protein ligase BRE1, putative [Entamoeba dispar SAW760]EDR24469.1 E3 ubiquitin protein ligase BRE1, putative [Entamoeba dispar SAW760]|eukprot:EDR24469.1 E3 ubiquitin protein ligase BRE1, putative [Entamoeba dispar SAW760]